ncbi:hypothetical protein [Arenivirga flava]|uniref:LPXTG cell wall anchor domain-containing protein n=1 Tax=Arenivirga flava TaxID=1930060 RepID=A0AA37XD08_9MICO|nr:hypothetical protein [Arenivirga flava]GMA29087.1 hypothetical protein GCM10025874_23400 [Arenivirga flava]
MNGLRGVLATGIAAGLLVLHAPVPASADGSAVSVEPETVAIDVPAPGHSTTWSMSVTNRTHQALPLAVAVTGAEGPVTTGATPVVVTLASTSGDRLIDATPAGELVGSTVPLDALAPGETRELRGEAALPQEADDRYQGAGGRLTFRFVASVESAPANAPALGRTGAEVAAGLALTATLLLGGIASIIIGRRRRTRSE